MHTDRHFWAVVPAGGAGTRLWPVSRAARPKFLLDLTGSGRTLIQQTVDRLVPLVQDRVLVVTGAAHREQVMAQLPGLPPGQVLAEPAPRDSMAAIGLAAALLERRDPEAILGSFAADHVIGDEEAFRRCVAEAVSVAETGHIVTLGIEPVAPATGFGYIHQGERLGGFDTARAVRGFTEKPDQETARTYLESGEYRWNAGMFVSRAGVLLDELSVEHPDLAEGLREIAGDPERLEGLWPDLTRIAIDHAVAEPAAARGRVATVPGTFAWDDLGDYAALRGRVGASAGGGGDALDGLDVLGDATLVRGIDASGLVVTGGRTVALLGVEDVVVVDTGDVVLVADAARAQDVKRFVEELSAEGRRDLV